MTNYEIKDKINKSPKELSPEMLFAYVEEYPGLRADYEEVLEAGILMNDLVQEYDLNSSNIDFDDWNKRQTEAHNNLIDKVVEFIDVLEKFDSEEAKSLRLNYNHNKEKRLMFTQLALKFLKRKAS